MPRRPIGRPSRRPLRRPIRGPLGRRRGPGLRPSLSGGRQIPPVLIAANQLFRSGEYEEAGKTYLNLAEKGIARGIRQAPNLYIQAARCYIMLGKMELALTVLRKAAEYFSQEERWADLYRGLKLSKNFLNDKGYFSEVQIVEGWTIELIPASVLKNLESTSKQREEKKVKVVLPTHCPSCGGTINPREVEWVDETSSICDFCGSIVRGE